MLVFGNNKMLVVAIAVVKHCLLFMSACIEDCPSKLVHFPGGLLSPDPPLAILGAAIHQTTGVLLALFQNVARWEFHATHCVIA